jgi:hypothetical protein
MPTLVILNLRVSGVYIEQFGITKVGIHLLGPGVYIDQCGLTKVVIHLLVSCVYIGYTKLFDINFLHK